MHDASRPGRPWADPAHGEYPHPSGIFGARSPAYTDPGIPRHDFAPYGPYSERITNRFSVAAFAVTVFNMVVGTLSLILTGPFFSMLVSAIGIICGHVALRQLRRPDRRAETGRLLAGLSLAFNYAALFFVAGLTVLLLVFTGIGRAVLGI